MKCKYFCSFVCIRCLCITLKDCLTSEIFGSGQLVPARECISVNRNLLCTIHTFKLRLQLKIVGSFILA